MNIPIKFRGKRIDNGEFVYGYLIQHFINSRVAKAIIYWNLVMHEVDPDSVRQLVCFDKYDNEVYDGDTVVDGFGAQYVVRLSATTQDIAGSFDFVPYPPDFVLKENQQ